MKVLSATFVIIKISAIKHLYKKTEKNSQNIFIENSSGYSTIIIMNIVNKNKTRRVTMGRFSNAF